MSSRLKTLRLERGWTHEQAGNAMGISRGQYIKLERGERRLTSDYIDQAARAFGVPPSAILDGNPTVPLVGYVGAGAKIDFGTSQGPFGEVEAPPQSSASTVAVKVRGDSMPGTAEDGWILYYDKVESPPTDDMLTSKSPVVVATAGDNVFVKRLRRGSQEGRYHLLSSGSEDPLLDVRIAWAAKVRFIKPSWAS